MGSTGTKSTGAMGSSGAMGMGGAKAGTTTRTASSGATIVINHGAVVDMLLPGVIVTLIGVFLLVSAFDERRRPPVDMVGGTIG